MPWETNRLLERKHCPLFRMRLQPLVKYYKLLTSMIISFQGGGITVKKLLTPPEDSEREEAFVQDTPIDAGCFQNVCKRLGCQHCWEEFSDEEFVEAVREVRKDKKRRSRAGNRSKRDKSMEDSLCSDVKVI